VNLAQGFPDFAAPAEVKDAAVRAVQADINQYAITGERASFAARLLNDSKRIPDWPSTPNRRSLSVAAQRRR